MEVNRVDRLRQFLGLPHILPSGIKIHSPTIADIGDIGEGVYNLYLYLATFNKYDIVTSLFKPSPEELSEISNIDDYVFLISTPLLPEIENALSFFTRSNVIFRDNAFYVENTILVDSVTYVDFSKVIKELNGMSDKPKLKFRTKKAEEDYYRIQEFKKKYENDGLLLKDLCSILCNAEGNGINVFNIGKLTIYQVYEHFERLSVKESHRRMLQVWANGHLKEDIKLQDWLVKTKL